MMGKQPYTVALKLVQGCLPLIDEIYTSSPSKWVITHFHLMETIEMRGNQPYD